MKRIGICSDHAGVDYKTRLIAYLLGKGYEVVNFGTDSTDSCDYADFAHPMANAIALCLNHHKGIRAGLAWNQEVASLVKEHNNANVLVMPARFVSYRMAVMMVRAWLTTQFAGGRHQRRIDKIVQP